MNLSCLDIGGEVLVVSHLHWQEFAPKDVGLGLIMRLLLKLPRDSIKNLFSKFWSQDSGWPLVNLEQICRWS